MPVVQIGMDISGLRSGASQAASTLRGISDSADQARKSSDALSASIARAAKQVLSLVGAYKALDSVKAFAERGVAFNSAMEQSQISIGSLITSMATLVDEQGKILTGAEKYAAAQGIASNMMKEIQRLGLETTATTTELVDGVQGVMGSALNAGMKLEQIPQFAVAAAQAMQTMQIPLNQMRTEIDALLTGNINKAQDLLAPRLGIDKETINSWKEQGILVEKLMEKLGAFQQAGKDVAQTWAGLTSNLSEAIDLISGRAATGLSDSLKESAKSLQELFVTTKEGTVGISKDFENVAQVIERVQTAIGEGILASVNAFADGVRALNSAIGDMGGADAVFSNVKTATLTLAAALASLKAVRSDSIRQTAQAIASEVQYARAVASGNAVVLGSAEAHRQQALAAVEAARAENEAARAAEAEAAAQLRSAQAKLQNAVTSRQVATATQQQSAAQYNLAEAQERARITSAALASAEGKLAMASRVAATQAASGGAAITAASGIWARATAAISAGAARAATAIKGLWAAMGGGVGVALTAIITGLTYLSTRQTDAERSTKLLQEAQEAYANATKGAIDETGRLTRSLGELERTQLGIAQKKLAAAQTAQIQEISTALREAMQEVINFQNRAAAEALAIPGLLASEREALTRNLIPPEAKQQLDDLIASLKSGKSTPKEFADALSSMRNALVESGHGANAFVATIDKIISGDESAIETLIKTSEELNRNKEALGDHAATAKEAEKASIDYAAALESIDKAQQTTLNGEKDAVEWLLKRTENTKTMTEATEENARAKDQAAISELALAEAMAQLSVSAAQAMAMMAANTDEAVNAAANLQAAEAKLAKITAFREQAQKGLEDLYAGRAGKGGGKKAKTGGGGGGASQIDGARESIKRLEEEIARMNGTLNADGGKLAKKTAEIEKMGKQARMSAAEIGKLQSEYAEAFKADTLREFDKAVLQIEGNTQALRELEIAQTLKDWTLKFADLGMSAEQAAPYLERLKNALATQESYKDLQTAADFYKDLADLSGEYGQSIEYQNQLIEKQAELWLQAGIPLADVERRVQLMRQDLSRDMFSGLVRGARKFGAEYGDMAAQVEGFTTQMGNHISNSLADAFMKGKFSAQYFFSSLISMAAQAASNAFIGQIFGGVGNILGGFIGGGFLGGGAPTSGFSGTANNFSSNPSFVGPMIPTGVYHSGGDVRGAGKDGREMPLSLFANAPRLHGGGGYFASDEYPAVLLRGERVLNRREAQAYNAGQASALPAGAGARGDVTVNVINQTSQQVDASTQTRQEANGTLTLDVILKQVDSGMAGLAKQGKSQFGAYMQKAYGLDRANVIMQGRGRV